MGYCLLMPRNSDKRRDPSPLTTRGASRFTMQDPANFLASHSPASLRPVSEFVPHKQQGHEWQADAFVYNRLIGEIGYLHDTTAKLVAACDLTVFRDDEDPVTATITSSLASDPRVNRVMRAFVGPVGGRKELLRRAAFHYQVAGESILTATPLYNELGQEQGLSWEFLSPREIKTESKKVDGKSVTQVMRKSGAPDDGFLPIDASLARWWRSDPEFSAMADSPMRRVLPICRELVILSEVVDAIAKSRLNAGILVIPEEMSYGPDDETTEEVDGEEDVDSLMRDLAVHLSAPVEDRTSGSGLIPLILKGPAEFISKIQMVWLSRDLDGTYEGLRSELLVRISQGLDAPPEMLVGKASLNHWSAYSVDADFVDRHVAPLGDALCEFLTVSYLRRMLVLHEGMAPEEADCFRISFDPRPLAQNEDEAGLASSGWDRVILSDAAWLRANGFTESDVASDDERKRRILEKIIFSAPGIYGPTLLPALYPELAGSADAAAQADSAQRQRNEADGPATPQAGDPTPAPAAPVPAGNPGPANGVPVGGPPVERPSGTPPEQRSTSAEDALVAKLALAAHDALLSALEKEADGVLSKMDSIPDELQRRLSDKQKVDVLSLMSRADLTLMGVDMGTFFNDAWDSFADEAQGWIKDWASSTGAPATLANEVSSRTTTHLCQGLDFLARSSIGSPVPVASNGLGVPDALIRRSVHKAVEEISARS